jgi:predicted dehydrogenase
VKKLALVGLNNSHPFILSGVVNGGNRAAFVRNSPQWTHRLFPDRDWEGMLGENWRFTRAWARDPKFAAAVAEATNVEKVAGSLGEAASETEGAFVCDMWGEYHRGQALAFLEQGKSVFVDKPIAESVTDARAMIEAAEAHGAVLSHCSSTRFDKALLGLKKAIAERLGHPAIVTVCAPCYQDLARYAVHGIEILSSVMGGAKVERLRNIGNGQRRHLMLLDFADGACGVIHAWEGHAYTVTVTAPGGQEVVSLGSDSYVPMIEAVLGSFMTGTPVVPYEEVMQVVRIIEAASLSRQRDGAPVELGQY